MGLYFARDRGEIRSNQGEDKTNRSKGIGGATRGSQRKNVKGIPGLNRGRTDRKLPLPLRGEGGGEGNFSNYLPVETSCNIKSTASARFKAV